jgi:GMP synthase (glutamine-hydrolysing)
MIHSRSDSNHDAIAVVDFGGQYAHLIATKVRRHRVLAEIKQPEEPVESFQKYKGIILSGSPALSSLGEEAKYSTSILTLHVPILGLCFGHQEIAKHYGGTVVHGGREWGHAALHLTRKDHPLFKNLEAVEQVWMSHFDSVTSVGEGFEEFGYTILGKSGVCHRFAAIGSDKYQRYGFQFHAEVDDTPSGEQMIANFVLGICKCRPTWTVENYAVELIGRIREQVGNDAVFLLASGGVDSTVAAKLFGEALGSERLHLLHIDNGLMRKDESREVLQMLRALGLGRHLHFVDASAEFLKALEGVVEPEKKRAIIGNTFVRVFEREAAALGIADHLLGQGTIYPDTIETGGTKRADTIKTHHNRVPIIEQMVAEGRVVEPLVDLYKVEVRELGKRLGIPRDLIWRHPFPGPGLGVRLLCSSGEEEFDPEKLSARVAEIVGPFGVGGQVLPIRSVGVKADLRSYEHPVMLTGSLSWDEMLEVGRVVLKEVDGINRCVWNLKDTFPQSIQLLPANITVDRLDILREADFVVMQGLKRHGIYDRIWQCPTVLLPLQIDGTGRELCIVRPIFSERAMTASPAPLPPLLLDELREQILSLPGVAGLAVDLTSKPPGTIEWE